MSSSEINNAVGTFKASVAATGGEGDFNYHADWVGIYKHLERTVAVESASSNGVFIGFEFHWFKELEIGRVYALGTENNMYAIYSTPAGRPISTQGTVIIEKLEVDSPPGHIKFKFDVYFELRDQTHHAIGRVDVKLQTL
ncbi:hypothetical protein [Pseudomonas nunensis]|uniref:hypothetical protein n=1 Tax=Pseudomonas nunensis TaxID=2961896 RepID=UPI0012E0E38C|nr:hypothetical protein [Pseudomonas nunensis]